MSTLAVESLLSPEQVASFHRDGFVVVRQLLSPEEVATIRDTFMMMNANGPVPGLSEMKHGGPGAYSEGDPLRFYPRMMHPHRHPDKPVGPLAFRYLIDARVKSVLSELMGEDPVAVQTMFYFKPPGARGQDFHQDNFYLRVKPGTCMAAWMAIDDCDEENGGMACVRNTANYDTQCPTAADPTKFFTTEHVEPPAGMAPETVVMKAGDVLFFNGQTIHGSTPNTSKTRFRRSLICHYVPRSTKEMSHWYEAFDFDGSRIPITKNEDGGPCGTPNDVAMGASPH